MGWLFFDLDAFPECYIIGYFFVSWVRCGIIPCCVFIYHAVDVDIIVTGLSFDGTGGVGVAFFERLFVY